MLRFGEKSTWKLLEVNYWAILQSNLNINMFTEFKGKSFGFYLSKEKSCVIWFAEIQSKRIFVEIHISNASTLFIID